MMMSSWMTYPWIQTQWMLVDNQYPVPENKTHLFLGH
jgi:hypothetical protein